MKARGKQMANVKSAPLVGGVIGNIGAEGKPFGARWGRLKYPVHGAKGGMEAVKIAVLTKLQAWTLPPAHQVERGGPCWSAPAASAALGMLGVRPAERLRSHPSAGRSPRSGREPGCTHSRAIPDRSSPPPAEAAAGARARAECECQLRY